MKNYNQKPKQITMNKEKPFTPIDVQMDYSDNTVSVHYEGLYDMKLAIEYAKKYYPSIQSIIIDNYYPNEFKGFINEGIVTIL